MRPSARVLLVLALLVSCLDAAPDGEPASAAVPEDARAEKLEAAAVEPSSDPAPSTPAPASAAPRASKTKPSGYTSASCPANQTVVSGTSGNDTKIVTAGNTCVVVLEGNDLVFHSGSSPGLARTTLGGPGADNVSANSNTGNHRIDLWSGDDNLSLVSGTNEVYGGEGNDTIATGSGVDTVFAGDGDDVVSVGGSPDFIDLGAGDDIAYGGAGADTILGGDGNDVFTGGTGGGHFEGNAGNDIFTGGSGSETLIAGPGRDTVYGNGGNDTVVIYDLCEIESGEILDGGGGTDTLVTAVGLQQLQTLGVTVSGFETVIIAANPTLSECRAGCTNTRILEPRPGQAPIERGCIEVDWGCRNPTEAQLEIDGTPVLARVEAQQDSDEPESSYCYDGDALGIGTHTAIAAATCTCTSGVESTTSDSRSFSTTGQGFRIDKVFVAGESFKASETVRVDVHAGVSGLTVSIDFSEMDSGYVPSAETVTDLGEGWYRVEYTLSSANTRATGVYDIHVRAQQGSAMETRRWPLTWLPRGSSPVRPATGVAAQFMAAPPPSPQTPGTLGLGDAVIVEGSDTIDLGDTVVVRAKVTGWGGPGELGSALLLLRDTASDGFYEMVVPVVRQCDASGCADEVFLEMTALAAQGVRAFGGPLTLQASVVDSAGNPSSWLPVPGVVGDPVGPEDFSVQGRMVYETRLFDMPDTDSLGVNSRSPQKENGEVFACTLAVIDMRVQVLPCPTSAPQTRFEGSTSYDGSFHIDFKNVCPSELVEIRVVPQSTNERAPVKIVGLTLEQELTQPREISVTTFDPDALADSLGVVDLGEGGPGNPNLPEIPLATGRELPAYANLMTAQRSLVFSELRRRLLGPENRLVEAVGALESNQVRRKSNGCVDNNTTIYHPSYDAIEFPAFDQVVPKCTPPSGNIGLLSGRIGPIRTETQYGPAHHEFGHFLQAHYMREQQTDPGSRTGVAAKYPSNDFGESWAHHNAVLTSGYQISYDSSGTRRIELARSWRMGLIAGDVDAAVPVFENDDHNGAILLVDTNDDGMWDTKVLERPFIPFGGLKADGVTRADRQEGYNAQFFHDFADRDRTEPQTSYPDPAGGSSYSYPSPDPIVNDPGAVLDVMFGYLSGAELSVNPAFVLTGPAARGVEDENGEDYLELTDFIDGYWCRGHATQEQIEMLRDLIQYQYTFNGPQPGQCLRADEVAGPPAG